MEQNEVTTTPVVNNKPDNKFKIATIIVSIIAICGIGFGVYEFLDNNHKSQKITDLQSQITDLQNQINQINTKPNGTNQKIKIVSSSWSGWSEEYEPEKTESYCEIELNTKCVVKTQQLSDTDENEWEEEVLSFEITSINEDSVSIHTFQVFSDQETGIDLSSDKQDFIINSDEELELTTPTMDAGDIFILSLVNE